MKPLKKRVAQNRNQNINKETSKFLNKLGHENPKSHDSIMNSQIMPLLSSDFGNVSAPKDIHDN